MPNSGLFVGLSTLDLIYLVDTVPTSNQKIVSRDAAIAAGGPASNAAVTFGYLGNSALLLSVLGSHPTAKLVQADLQQWGVAIADLAPERVEPCPTSSILVTQSTGDRAVVSLNAVKAQMEGDRIPSSILTKLEQREIQIVLMDGHQIAVGAEIAQRAKDAGIPVVVDGGSWKPGFEQVLQWADYAICSANFRPPENNGDPIAYLKSLRIPHLAITHGAQPIQWFRPHQAGEIPVPAIKPVDTLGAGDIFHGAFCHFILKTTFEEAIATSAQVAARSCQFFGTRNWMRI